MYDRARVNLISEIQPALKCTTEEAEIYLDKALEKGVLKPAKTATKGAAKSAATKTPAKPAATKAASKKK
jgi:topoisomerase IA-like protein